MGRDYCVYIMTNEFRTLYIGVTGDLTVRVQQHKQKVTDGFTKRYDLSKLVHYESFGDVTRAIGREKELKGWQRRRKIALIESANPQWEDLAKDWYGTEFPVPGGPAAPDVDPSRCGEQHAAAQDDSVAVVRP